MALQDKKTTESDSFLALMANFLSSSEEGRERTANTLEPPEPDYPDGDDG